MSSLEEYLAQGTESSGTDHDETYVEVDSDDGPSYNEYYTESVTY